MANLAIIPARGGSKRIPKKNIRLFLGRPIIAYPIETALNSSLFDEVMVSTENEKIKELAIHFGGKVPFMRSDETAGDFSSTVDVLLEVVEEYEKQGRYFDNICCLYPTAPFVNLDVLSEALNLLENQKFDCVFPLVKYNAPIQRALQIDDNKVSMLQPENIHSRTQDLKDAFYDAGQFYWLNTKALKEKKQLWTDNTGAVEVKPLNVQDIDSLDDWRLAEIKYKDLMFRNRKEESSAA